MRRQSPDPWGHKTCCSIHKTRGYTGIRVGDHHKWFKAEYWVGYIYWLIVLQEVGQTIQVSQESVFLIFQGLFVSIFVLHYISNVDIPIITKLLDYRNRIQLEQKIALESYAVPPQVKSLVEKVRKAGDRDSTQANLDNLK